MDSAAASGSSNRAPRHLQTATVVFDPLPPDDQSLPLSASVNSAPPMRSMRHTPGSQHLQAQQAQQRLIEGASTATFQPAVNNPLERRLTGRERREQVLAYHVGTMLLKQHDEEQRTEQHTKAATSFGVFTTSVASASNMLSSPTGGGVSAGMFIPEQQLAALRKAVRLYRTKHNRNEHDAISLELFTDDAVNGGSGGGGGGRDLTPLAGPDMGSSGTSPERAAHASSAAAFASSTMHPTSPVPNNGSSKKGGGGKDTGAAASPGPLHANNSPTRRAQLLKDIFSFKFDFFEKRRAEFAAKEVQRREHEEAERRLAVEAGHSRRGKVHKHDKRRSRRRSTVQHAVDEESEGEEYSEAEHEERHKQRIAQAKDSKLAGFMRNVILDRFACAPHVADLAGLQAKADVEKKHTMLKVLQQQKKASAAVAAGKKKTPFDHGADGGSANNKKDAQEGDADREEGLDDGGGAWSSKRQSSPGGTKSRRATGAMDMLEASRNASMTFASSDNDLATDATAQLAAFLIQNEQLKRAAKCAADLVVFTAMRVLPPLLFFGDIQAFDMVTRELHDVQLARDQKKEEAAHAKLLLSTNGGLGIEKSVMLYASANEKNEIGLCQNASFQAELREKQHGENQQKLRADKALSVPCAMRLFELAVGKEEPKTVAAVASGQAEKTAREKQMRILDNKRVVNHPTQAVAEKNHIWLSLTTPRITRPPLHAVDPDKLSGKAEQQQHSTSTAAASATSPGLRQSPASPNSSKRKKQHTFKSTKSLRHHPHRSEELEAGIYEDEGGTSTDSDDDENKLLLAKAVTPAGDPKNPGSSPAKKFTNSLSDPEPSLLPIKELLSVGAQSAEKLREELTPYETKLLLMLSTAHSAFVHSLCADDASLPHQHRRLIENHREDLTCVAADVVVEAALRYAESLTTNPARDTPAVASKDSRRQSTADEYGEKLWDEHRTTREELQELLTMLDSKTFLKGHDVERVALQFLHENRLVVKEVLTRMKGELRYFMTGIDERSTVVEWDKTGIQREKNYQIQRKARRLSASRKQALAEAAPLGIGESGKLILAGVKKPAAMHSFDSGMNGGGGGGAAGGAAGGAGGAPGSNISVQVYELPCWNFRELMDEMEQSDSDDEVVELDNEGYLAATAVGRSHQVGLDWMRRMPKKPRVAHPPSVLRRVPKEEVGGGYAAAVTAAGGKKRKEEDVKKQPSPPPRPTAKPSIAPPAAVEQIALKSARSDCALAGPPTVLPSSRNPSTKGGAAVLVAGAKPAPTPMLSASTGLSGTFGTLLKSGTILCDEVESPRHTQQQQQQQQAPAAAVAGLLSARSSAAGLAVHPSNLTSVSHSSATSSARPIISPPAEPSSSGSFLHKESTVAPAPPTPHAKAAAVQSAAFLRASHSTGSAKPLLPHAPPSRTASSAGPHLLAAPLVPSSPTVAGGQQGGEALPGRTTRTNSSSAALASGALEVSLPRQQQQPVTSARHVARQQSVHPTAGAALVAASPTHAPGGHGGIAVATSSAGALSAGGVNGASASGAARPVTPVSVQVPKDLSLAALQRELVMLDRERRQGNKHRGDAVATAAKLQKRRQRPTDTGSATEGSAPTSPQAALQSLLHRAGITAPEGGVDPAAGLQLSVTAGVVGRKEAARVEKLKIACRQTVTRCMNSEDALLWYQQGSQRSVGGPQQQLLSGGGGGGGAAAVSAAPSMRQGVFDVFALSPVTWLRLTLPSDIMEAVEPKLQKVAGHRQKQMMHWTL